MTSTMSRWPKLLSIGAFSLLLFPTHHASAVGFPTAACREGFIQAGPRLCITQAVQQAAQFDTAMVRCRNKRARVATYGDLYYLYRNVTWDYLYSPGEKWLGEDVIRDDTALCGNMPTWGDDTPSQENFEGTCNKNDIRQYWCAHDDE